MNPGSGSISNFFLKIRTSPYSNLVFVLPALIMFLIFNIYPFYKVFVLSVNAPFTSFIFS